MTFIGNYVTITPQDIPNHKFLDTKTRFIGTTAIYYFEAKNGYMPIMTVNCQTLTIKDVEELRLCLEKIQREMAATNNRRLTSS